MTNIARWRALECAVVLVLAFALQQSARAQDNATATSANTAAAAVEPQTADGNVPRIIRFSGIAQDETHNPTTGVVGITFSLYKDQQGGSPLWLETQNVQADANGHYTALLGSASAEGMPLELFSSGEAHWLGVQIQGLPEHARVLLVSVPYALKAYEAETLSGRSISDFVLLNKTGSSSSNATATPVGSSGTSGSSSPLIDNDGPTTFAGANATQIVNVTQNGSGLGLSATAHTLAAVAGTITGKSNTAVYGLASNTSKGSNAAGVTGQSNTETGPGVAGYANGANGTGVLGVANATSGGTGVSGIANSTTGAVNGVSGQTASTGQFAAGVSGSEFASTGQQVYGVNGYNLSAGLNAAGVNGWEAATTGQVYGVSGGTNSTQQYAAGVSGYEGASTGDVNGVAGDNLSTGPYAAGVSGFEAATTGQVYGVWGGTNSTTQGAVGVNGYEGAATGSVAGVAGTSASTSGIGVSGSATATTGNAYGVTGSTATTGFGAGVAGSAVATTGSAFGVFGQSSGTSGNGVFGYASAPSGSTIGVSGFVESPTGTAGRFVANAGSGLILQGVSGSSGTNVVFTVDASGNLDISGNLTVAGSKSARVKLQDGRDVALYAVESPENWFEDFGTAQLQRGGAKVSLEPGFLQTVDTAADYHVFLTPKGDCHGLYVAGTTSAGFEVRELGGGNASIAFDYRIVARRRGFEKVRLQEVHVPQVSQEVKPRLADLHAVRPMTVTSPPRVTIPILPHPAPQAR
jgi:trimeric autotransporter adhesin